MWASVSVYTTAAFISRAKNGVSMIFDIFLPSDYHLVHQFMDDCGDDIKKTKCGRIFDDGETEEKDGVSC